MRQSGEHRAMGVSYISPIILTRILGSQVPWLRIPTLVARPRWLRISWARDGAGSVPFMDMMTGCREQRPDCGCGPGPALLSCRLLAIPRGTQKGAGTCWAALGARLEPSRDQGWHWPCPLRRARLFQNRPGRRWTLLTPGTFPRLDLTQSV